MVVWKVQWLKGHSLFPHHHMLSWCSSTQWTAPSFLQSYTTLSNDPYSFCTCSRLTPAIALLIAFTTIYMDQLNAGPYYETNLQILTKPCADYWWRNLLYINNLFKQEEMVRQSDHTGLCFIIVKLMLQQNHVNRPFQLIHPDSVRHTPGTWPTTCKCTLSHRFSSFPSFCGLFLVRDSHTSIERTHLEIGKKRHEKFFH